MKENKSGVHEVVVFILLMVNLLAIFIFSTIGFGFLLKLWFGLPLWVGCLGWIVFILVLSTGTFLLIAKLEDR